jgi:hypothetical protein
MPIKRFTDNAETSLGLGPVADTVVVDLVDYPETPAAWSLERELELDGLERAGFRSWRDAWVRAGLIAAAAAGIAAVITISGAAIHAAEHQDDETRSSWATPGVPWAPPTTATATSPATSAPPPTTSTTSPQPLAPAPTVTVTQTPAAAPPRTTPQTTTPAAADRDRQYLADLRAAGITIVDPVRVAGNGPRVCAYIAAGHTEQQAVAAAMSDNPTLTRNNAITVVDAAIAVYCPEEN